MKRVLTAGLLVLGLGACQSDPYCRSHTAADLIPSRAAWARMTPAERQDSARALNNSAQRCGWEP